MSSSPKSGDQVPDSGEELDDEQLDEVAGGAGHELAHTVQQLGATTDDSTSTSSEYVVQRNESDLSFSRR